MSCSHSDGNWVATNHARDDPASVPAFKQGKRPGKARVLSEADLDFELNNLEAGRVGNGGETLSNGVVGDGGDVGTNGHAHSHGTATKHTHHRPGKARVLTEADLDVELGDAGVKTTNGVPAPHVTQIHGHSHVGGHGPCHGFEDDDILSGGWFNAGHAENVFGGTRIGRRLVPAARAEKVKKKLYCAFAISGAYAVAEIIAAHLSGSTALLADAAHMLSDFFSYALSIGILWITTRALSTKDEHEDKKEDDDETTRGDVLNNNSKKTLKVDRLTFGVARLEVLGALGIILIVWIATGALVVEAGSRLTDPSPVDGRVVVLTAIGGLVVDSALLYLLSTDSENPDTVGDGHGHSHGAGELSSGAMFAHVVGDLFGTIVVCLGGTIVWSTGNRSSPVQIVDPICTFIFCALVVYTTFPFGVRMLWILMEAAPPGCDPNEIAEALQRESPAVVGVHCLHVWEIAPGKTALTAHIHVDATLGGNAGAGSPFRGELHGGALEEALRKSTRLCQKKFGVKHVTLQVTATPEQGGFSACGNTGTTMSECDKCDN